MAFSTMAAAFVSPRWSSISAAAQICPIGLAIHWPAMSGADPWTGSNKDGKRRSGLILPAGAALMLDQDVAEQIARHHNVEPIGILNEMRGQDIDVVFVPVHLRI